MLRRRAAAVTFAAILLLLLGAVIALQIDDELDPDAVELLALADQREETDAYYYLMGIYAAAQDDPISVGRALYDSLAKADRAYLETRRYPQVENYPKELKLPLPDGELFCPARDVRCVGLIVGADRNIEALVEQHSLLLQRYTKYVAFADYSTLTRATLYQPHPGMRYFSAGARLTILACLQAGAEQAIECLTEHINTLRKQLVLQDNMIGKLAVLADISVALDILFVTASTSDLAQPMIAQLSSAERNLDIAIAREFAVSYDTLQHLDRNPGFFRTEDSWESVPGWIVRIFYKPNMSVNPEVPDFTRLIRISKLSHTEFADEVFTEKPEQQNSDSVRNLAGSILISLPRPDRADWIQRWLDLDAKIQLFNALINSDDIERDAPKIKNPYFPSKVKAFIDRESGRVCFRGPLSNQSLTSSPDYLRCLAYRL